MIERSERDGIVELRLAHGRASALDVELAGELERAMRELDGSAARAAVLTGSGGIFSAGVDLFRLVDGGPEYLDRFLPALEGGFRALFEVSKPVVAAINGHAIAGGCVMAAACDLRVMARGPAGIGIPELKVGVPFPAIALEIMRLAVPAPWLQAAVYTGATYAPDEALRRGFVDELADADVLTERARELAAELASIPARAFALTKRELRGPGLERAARIGDATRAELVAAWKDPATVRVIREYASRTIGKRT